MPFLLNKERSAQNERLTEEMQTLRQFQNVSPASEDGCAERHCFELSISDDAAACEHVVDQ
ncbi:hypothetical protein Q0M97_14430, partial [Staphylococcus aureus]|nr:hypothetical protein [Staphylococcus aureus]